MNIPREPELERFKKEEDEKKEKEKDIEHAKLKGNENTEQNKYEVIYLFNYTKNNIHKLQPHLIIIGTIILFIILILMIFFSFFKRNHSNLQKYQNQNQTKATENYNNTSNITTSVNKNITNNITENENRKKVLGFLFPELTIFMVTNGDHFSNTGKYEVLFMTKSPIKGELKYNMNIKRINCYFNRTLINQTCQKYNIDFLIVNSDLSADDIKWLKSLNIKLIAISKDFENKNQTNDLQLFDAYINQNYEDFSVSKNINLNNNILIPDMLNLELRDLASLSNHNIMMIGELNETKLNISSMLSSFSFIVKEIPDTKINFFSLDKPSNELNELIDKLSLTQNIHFYPLNDNISNDIIKYSLFIYASMSQDHQNILFDAKSYGLPCVSFIEFPNNLFFNSGIINLNITQNEELIIEILKLLIDDKYKKIVGKEIKYSLKMINDEIQVLWEYLFHSLKNDENEFQSLRADIERRIKSINHLSA